MENVLNALIWLTNFSLIPAITYGSQLALGALGITLVFSILRFGNFAHGETMSIGTAFTILFMWLLIWLGGGLFPLSIGPIPIPTALLALFPAVACTAAIVFLTDVFVYKHYRKKRVSPTMMAMVSVGVMFAYAGLVRVLIGVEERSCQGSGPCRSIYFQSDRVKTVGARHRKFFVDQGGREPSVESSLHRCIGRDSGYFVVLVFEQNPHRQKHAGIFG